MMMMMMNPKVMIKSVIDSIQTKISKETLQHLCFKPSNENSFESENDFPKLNVILYE